MKWCKVDSENIVDQVQPYSEPDFVECPDDVVCGMLFDGKKYIAPDPEKTQQQIDRDAKFAGVDFAGVMCSATREDMWGLAAIKSYILAGNSINFEFSNGNFLVLTPENVADFETLWTPFRASFFPVPA